MENQDYLSHHGVLGMKWGRRNGPPYPLGPGDHSASEKKAGWEDSLSPSARKKIAKEYTKKLNYLDQRRVEQVAYAHRAGERMGNIMLKANRREDKLSEEQAKSDEKLKKLNAAYADKIIEGVQHARNSNVIADEITKVVNDAEKNGYTVEATYRMRVARLGKNKVAKALSDVGDFTLTVISLSNKPVEVFTRWEYGKQYKVRYNQEQKR